MPTYDPTQIANLVGQLGGDHQQAARQLRQMGGQIDPRQHADALRQMGIDPRKLQNGDYRQHLDAQAQPGFQGYQSGDMSGQTPQFGGSQDSQGDQNGKNFQQLDQSQGGMRGMKPDQDQQGSDDDTQKAGQQPRQQSRQRSQQESQLQGQGQQDYSDQQNP